MDTFNKFIISIVGLVALAAGVYFLIQALLAASLPMQGLYFAVLGFGSLWSGYYALRQVS